MAKMQIKDKTIYKREKTTVDEHGEIKKKETESIVVQSKEPHFVKVYFDTILVFRELPKNISPLIGELLKRMTFADREAMHGGQLIALNAYVKNEIAAKLNLKVNTVEHQLTSLVKVGIFRRVGNSTYQGNPHIFGRGDWHDIKAIRATFDFNTGTVEADIKRGPPRETVVQSLEIQLKAAAEHSENQQKNSDRYV